MKEPVVYILRSIKNNRYYIGSTDNIEQRLTQHNSGQVKATKNNTPFEVMITIPCPNLSEAKGAEYRLKKYKRRDILEKVIQDRTFPWDYRGA